MRVGVYGDSYAASHMHGVGKPWHQILKDEFNVRVLSYGVNGSSLYYSFTKFKETHHRYEKIVFLVTGPGRFMLPLPPPWSTDPLLMHVNSYNGFKQLVENSHQNAPYLKETAIAVEGYYKYVMNFEADDLFHQLLVKEIKTIRPDALIIPCFYKSGEESWPVNETLNDISEIDIKYYNIDSQKARWADKRHCHMNNENSYIFAGMVAEWLNSGSFDFDITKFVNPTEPIDRYFNTDLLK